MNDQSGDVLVSIIIATYNASFYIGECLQSIKSQTSKNIEVVLVDGASTDNTMAIVKASGLPLLNWVSEPDKGIYDAMNKGIGMARGKWIYFLGADDRLLPDFSQLLTHLQDNRTVYYGNSDWYADRAEVPYTLLQGSFSSYRLAKWCINHQSILYPRAVFDKYMYDVRYKVNADYALNMAVWGDRRFKKQHYEISIVTYNLSGFSFFTKDQVFEKDKLKLIRQRLGWWTYARLMIKHYKTKMRRSEG